MLIPIRNDQPYYSVSIAIVVQSSFKNPNFEAKELHNKRKSCTETVKLQIKQPRLLISKKKKKKKNKKLNS